MSPCISSLWVLKWTGFLIVLPAKSFFSRTRASARVVSWFLKGVDFIYQWYCQILRRVAASSAEVHHPFHKGILCFSALNFPVGYMKDILLVPSLLNDLVCLVHCLDLLIIYYFVNFWEICKIHQCKCSLQIADKPWGFLWQHRSRSAQLAYSYIFRSVGEFCVLWTNFVQTNRHSQLVVETNRHKAVVSL